MCEFGWEFHDTAVIIDDYIFLLDVVISYITPSQSSET